MNSRGQWEGTLIIATLVIVVLFLAAIFCFGVVPSGHIGVQDTFGDVSNDTKTPGFTFKGPFTGIVSISLQTQEIKESASVPTSEGLIVQLDTSVLYKVNPAEVVKIYKTLGLGYREVIVEPNIRSAVREVTSKYEAKALYSGDKRDQLALEIENRLRPILAERGVIVEQVLLRDIKLPTEISDAIAAKLKREQESQAMEFVLTKEKQEATRKTIEAQGIKDSQDIINQTLTTKYLQYLWISKLNENPNIIYVPIDSEGLTLFRNVDSFPDLNKTGGQ